MFVVSIHNFSLSSKAFCKIVLLHKVLIKFSLTHVINSSVLGSLVFYLHFCASITYLLSPPTMFPPTQIISLCIYS